MDKKPKPLDVEFDDSVSMEELLGQSDDTDDTDDRSARKRRPTALPPVSPIDMSDATDMAALLDQGDTVDEELEDTDEDQGMPSELFGEMDSGSMAEILDSSDQVEAAEGHIIDISLAGATAQLPTGNRGFIDKQEFADWSAVQVGDAVQVSFKPDDPGAELTLSLLSHDPRPAPKSHETDPHTAQVFDGFKPGSGFVLDASNICRSFAGTSTSSLAPLLTLVNGIMERDGTCICVFDANERYKLAQNRHERNSDRIYEDLLQELSKIFIEAPAAASADDYLLKIAHRERLPVISNDRFNKASDGHRDQYPWLVSGGSRLIRGSADDTTVRIPRLKLVLPINNDLRTLVQSIKLMVVRHG